MLYRNLPTYKDKAFFIMVGMSGTWLLDATHPQCRDEAWCKRFVQHFEGDYGDGTPDKWGGKPPIIHQVIQQMIDDQWEDQVNNGVKMLMV